MKNKLLSILLLLISNSLYSQSENKFDSILDVGIKNISKDLNISINALNEISKFEKKTTLQKIKINYLKHKINKFTSRSKNKPETLNINEINPEEIKNPDSLLAKGRELVHNSYPDAALPLLFAFIKKTKQNKAYRDKRTFCKITIAEAYRKKREFKKGADILYTIIADKNTSDKNLIYAFSRISAIYNEQRNFDQKAKIDSVIKYSEKTMKLSKKNNDKFGLATSLNELGYIYTISRPDYKKAEKYLKEAFEYFLQENEYKNAVNTAINLSELYLRNGEYKKALAVGENAANICSIEGNEDIHMRLYLQLANIYDYNKMYHEAYDIISIGRRLQVELNHNLTDKTINELAAKYDLQIKEEQIKQEKINLKNAKKQRLYVYVILGITVILLVISYILAVLKNKNILQQKKLAEIEKEYMEEISELKNKDLLKAIAKKLLYDKVLLQIKEAVNKNEKREILNIINQNINTENNWDTFSIKFTELHPDFFAKLEKKFPDLTENEKKLSCLLFMNFKSKDIANVLNISESSVNKNRQRLRKKLKLEKAADISEYLKNKIE